MRYLSDLLLAHRESIQSSSLMSDQLIVELKETVTASETVLFFADLITFLNPTKAIALPDRRTIRVEF